MLALLNSLNADSFSILQSILMILVSKFMVLYEPIDNTHLLLVLLSPLTTLGGFFQVLAKRASCYVASHILLCCIVPNICQKHVHGPQIYLTRTTCSYFFG